MSKHSPTPTAPPVPEDDDATLASADDALLASFEEFEDQLLREEQAERAEFDAIMADYKSEAPSCEVPPDEDWGTYPVDPVYYDTPNHLMAAYLQQIGGDDGTPEGGPYQTYMMFRLVNDREPLEQQKMDLIHQFFGHIFCVARGINSGPDIVWRSRPSITVEHGFVKPATRLVRRPQIVISCRMFVKPGI